MLKENGELNKQNLKIFRIGLLVVDCKESYNCDFGQENQITFYMNNYSKTAASLNCVNLINYLLLMRSVNANLPEDFFKKFNKIHININIFFNFYLLFSQMI